MLRKIEAKNKGHSEEKREVEMAEAVKTLPWAVIRSKSYSLKEHRERTGRDGEGLSACKMLVKTNDESPVMRKDNNNSNPYQTQYPYPNQ